MRFLVYLVAVLVAAGIVFYLGGSRTPETALQATPATADGPATVDAGTVETVNLRVPDMHCPMACYPSVKKALEAEAGVQKVDLVEQKEEGLIDNPVVIIEHDAAFDVDQAVARLEKIGFKGATVASK
ncbi:heavy-metal-associated domain-containing protein [Candidatus Laterigemmans baculatus]|uniref:heavy-metal-associated domain-containing protein n=1 Tax=Candidatus Laterigemmans baculatus TaxID=2770505 RepID=UPI0013D91277|nr:heavy metal-associated domain-containing protein [Candidatus Laterigemmans baculatus]